MVCKKYKILEKLVYVMITVNISSNRHVVRSAVPNEFNTVPQFASSVIYAAFFRTFC